MRLIRSEDPSSRQVTKNHENVSARQGKGDAYASKCSEYTLPFSW
jgi:hypothetical protein